MLTKNWDFGTTIDVTVFARERTTRADVLAVTGVVNGERQAFVLTGQDYGDAKEGDAGQIEFTPGGPNGGYFRWRK